MTGKEKLRKALAHEEAPVLFDIGGMPTTGMHCSMVEKMREYYGLEKRVVKILEPMQMLGVIDEDLKEAMGIQTTPFWSDGDMFGYKQENFKEFKTFWGQTVLLPAALETDIDANGDLVIYPQGDRSVPPSARMPKSSYFFDAIVRNAELFDEDNYDFMDNCEEFGEVSQSTLDYYKKKVESLNTDDAVLGNLGGTAIGDIALVPGMSLKNPKGIRDIEEWYISTMIRQDELREIFDYEAKVGLANLEKIHAIIKDSIQVAYICGNDLGTQNGPFCSRTAFDELYAPAYKKINGWIHENTSWKTFKHSCGSIRPLIGGLIESGFDIVNPVQWTAKDMAKEDLKADFGSEVTFWGGGIDTQKTLPFGTPQEVYTETIECLKNFSKNGGYVFNSIHNIQAETPVENIASMAKAVKDYNGEN